ncbi:MAG: FxLD family lanthipeptide [Pseudonocardiaceae bacterium]
MVHGSTTLAPAAHVEAAGGFDDEFSLDLRVIEAGHPIAKLECDTSDQCGQTCSGSACNSNAFDPS